MDEGIAKMGEVVFSTPESTALKALGLGSCIGLCAFDPLTKMGCMAHIMLPEARTPDVPDAGKYANTAVPYVIEQMKMRGSTAMRLRFAIAGGAQLFSFAGSESKMDVGKRNIEAVKRHLAESKLRLVAEDVGGNLGRTLTFDASTGQVAVRLVGKTEKFLTNLAS